MSACAAPSELLEHLVLQGSMKDPVSGKWRARTGLGELKLGLPDPAAVAVPVEAAEPFHLLERLQAARAA